MTMNWVDAVVLTVWALTIFIGFRKGLIQTGVILGAFVGVLVLSTRFGELLGNVFSPVTDNENIQTIAGLSVIFVATGTMLYILIHLLTWLRVFWQRTFAFKLNRVGGTILGLIIGWVALSFALNVTQHFPIASVEQAVSESTLGSSVARFNARTIDQVILIIQIIPEDWLDHRNRDILAHPPAMYQPPESPSDLRHLAEYYAPVVFMDTAMPLPKADYLTAWDYDQDADPLNNWSNLSREGVDLGGRVYYWVLETSDHWFIGYGFFHPRDWGGENIDCISDLDATLGCHENDMEGALVTILRSNSEPYGKFLTLETIAHADILSFKDYDASPSSQVSDASPLCNKTNCDVQFIERGGRPYVYIEAKGHAVKGAIRGALRWEQNFPDGDGVLYFPTGEAKAPASSDDRSAGYQLVDINSLWKLRDNTSIFTSDPSEVGGSFLGDDGVANAASPPWRWADQHLPEIEAGVLFIDPAHWINVVHNGLVPWPVDYVRRSYDMD